MHLKLKPFFCFILFLLSFTIVPVIQLRAQTNATNKELHQLFDKYYEESLKLFPLSATSRGDNRYNDLLPNDGTEAYRLALHNFYEKYKNALQQYNYRQFNNEDKLSYDMLLNVIDRESGQEKFHPEYMPINQFYSLP